jgi:hypothetical protein
MKKLMSTFFLSLSIAVPTHAFEIDSFYQRDRNIKDSTTVVNQEINKKIQTAVAMTKSCDLKELYTNVRNQINADSSGMGIIGGMENWAEKNPAIEKIEPPSAENSIYSNTGFESIFKVGFWLKLWGTVKENSSQSVAKSKLAVRKLMSGSSDPLIICKIPEAQKEEAQKMIEMSKHQGPPGGPRGGPPGSGGSNHNGGPPPGPPPGDMQAGDMKGGPPPGGPGGFDSKFMDSEAGQCLKLVLNFKDRGQNVTLQSIIKVNGVNIGSDKLGHFFDQGFDLFQKEYSINSNSLTGENDGLTKALDYSMSTEDGMFGLKSSGVKSYGDLSANYGGSVFWKDLSLGSNPLVSCQDGKYKVSRPFDFKDYVTDAWDEGINCSEYSDSMTQQVEANLKARNTSCPVEVAKCQGLEKKYSAEVLSKILSPTCKKAMTAAAGTSSSQRGVK